VLPGKPSGFPETGPGRRSAGPCTRMTGEVMAATVVEAPLLERRQLSPLCFLLRLGAPEVARRAHPGQFVMVRGAERWPVLLPRPFSIADVGGGDEGEDPEWFDLLVHVRREGTRVLSEMSPGEGLKVTGPLGFGFTVVKDASAHVLIAGGVGAAPFPLLARWIARAEGEAPLYYLIGGPQADRLFFTDRLGALGARVLTATDDGSQGLHGLVTELLPQVEEELGGLAGAALYVTGPGGLLRACKQLAAERDLRCQLSMESRMGCGMGLCQGCVVKVRNVEGEGWHYRRVCYEGPVMWAHDVIFD